MRITLKANERIFINGAVIRPNKRVTLELMNDATFLLEGHIIHEDQTDTPLKQLYFTAQLILMDPGNSEKAEAVFHEMLGKMLITFSDRDILDGLRECAHLAQEGKMFEILKTIRSLFDKEATIMKGVVKHSTEERG